MKLTNTQASAIRLELRQLQDSLLGAFEALGQRDTDEVAGHLENLERRLGAAMMKLGDIEDRLENPKEA